MNGAQERTRTSTTVRPLAPEASASASSATWACKNEANISLRREFGFVNEPGTAAPDSPARMGAQHCWRHYARKNLSEMRRCARDETCASARNESSEASGRAFLENYQRCVRIPRARLRMSEVPFGGVVSGSRRMITLALKKQSPLRSVRSAATGPRGTLHTNHFETPALLGI
jgi:hypothetical protein